jgi:hypothetical protein
MNARISADTQDGYKVHWNKDGQFWAFGNDDFKFPVMNEQHAREIGILASAKARTFNHEIMSINIEILR